MSNKEFKKFHSQLDLPFQETKQIFLKEIFRTLESEFNLQKNSKHTFIDLGSGNGQVIIFSAMNYGIRSIGIEISPILIKETKNSIRLLKEGNISKKKLLRKIKLISGNFYVHNLRKYDIIYIYSLPTMHKYLKHVFQTVKSGSIIISHIYPLKFLTQYLEFKFKLEHYNENQEISTFFYRKI
ncbi:MAG: class I SAM-dependent methyltransferase [Candidatus Thorarchaeota archaeon]